MQRLDVIAFPKSNKTFFIEKSGDFLKNVRKIYIPKSIWQETSGRKKTCIYFKRHLNWQVEDVLIYLFAVCRIVDITHQAKNILI
jgi:hypothetical protein